MLGTSLQLDRDSKGGPLTSIPVWEACLCLFWFCFTFLTRVSACLFYEGQRSTSGIFPAHAPASHTLVFEVFAEQGAH